MSDEFGTYAEGGNGDLRYRMSPVGQETAKSLALGSRIDSGTF
jgi:hypothetical protein